MRGSVRYLNPANLHRNPAYSQAVIVSGNTNTIYVGGQNGVNTSGGVIAQGDLAAQTEQALRNVEAALLAGGAELHHVVKWNIYVVHGQSAQAGFEAFQKVWGQRAEAPAISVMFVAALAHPDFLVEIDAVAVVPQPERNQPTSAAKRAGGTNTKKAQASRRKKS